MSNGTGPTGATGATGPMMKSFLVRRRVTHPVEDVTVEAATRDQAIAQVVANADEGDQIEVLDAKEMPVEGGATGATGPTGTTTTSSKHSRAELNEMSKEELLDVAEAQGVEVNAHWNKADIVDAIVKHK